MRLHNTLSVLRCSIWSAAAHAAGVRLEPALKQTRAGHVLNKRELWLSAWVAASGLWRAVRSGRDEQAGRQADRQAGRQAGEAGGRT